MTYGIKNIFLVKTKGVLLVALGTLVLAFGTAVFIVPFDLIAGGISGMAIIIDKIIPYKELGIDAVIAALTWGLFAAGFILLGRSFAIKTFISTILYPPLFSLFYTLVSPQVLGGYFYLPGGEYRELSFLLASVCGGALVGIGCALSFLGGGSTGGTDIIAFIICKSFSRLNEARVIFIIDALVVLMGIFVIKDMTTSLLGIICAFISSKMVERFYHGKAR